MAGRDRAEAYRLIHPQTFTGVPTTYCQKTVTGDAALTDPNGFYHSMTVTHGGKTFILCGPPAAFVPGEPHTGRKASAQRTGYGRGSN